VFIIKFPENTENIINEIYKYEKLYKKNEFSNDGHIGVYQSEHNLHQNPAFEEISNKLEKFINLKLQKFINYNKLKIDKLWFVVTKNSGIIKRHSHFHSEFSGAFYLNVEENNENSNGLKLYNTLENLEILSYSVGESKFKIKKVTNEKTILLKPNKNDLIIFNSYLEHSVSNDNSKISERISLPFDLILNQ
uniref:TIGR02466 family protein n=1 Tax=Candidatus Pelagibacter sp. HIMB1521 TaxID=3413344 RepID=UPI003F8738AD